ncbi:MAG: protein BatD [Gammaproteobacteria bacterium]|nr:protein BatD [Gammaproteobacteria bacterium]
MGLVLLVPFSVRAASGITAQAWVGQTDPYVQETVVYTVRVYSTDNLRTIELTPPAIQGALLEELEGPLTGSQTVQGRRYVTNDYHFALTPMKTGALEVGQVRLKVKPVESRRWGSGYQSGNGEAVRVIARAVQLRARPSATDSRSWRPLQHLDIQAHWVSLEEAEAGEPLTLTVVTKARGATGAQVPSVEALLKTPDFKIYPERPALDRKVTGNGAYLWGRRVETFTLVPTREGGLNVPSLSLSWWDVGANAQTISKVPQRLILVGEAARKAGVDAFLSADLPLAARIFSWSTFAYLALPIGVALLAAFGFGWWMGTGQAPDVRFMTAFGMVGRWSRRVVQWVGGFTRTAVRVVVPVRIREGVGRASAQWRVRLRANLFDWVMAVLPKRAKAWWCSRCVDGETDPAGIYRVLRGFACANLSMSSNAPLLGIVERIIADHPTANAPPLRRLFHELDDAVYGRSELDLGQWKRAFRPQFRQAVISPPRESSIPRFGLPELNP